MAYEKSPLLLEPRSPVDAALWEPYVEKGVTGLDASSMLLPSAEQLAAEKKRFYASGQAYNPNLCPDADTVDWDQLDKVEQAAQGFKQDLKGIEADDDLKQAYRYRINEILGNARMVRAAAAGDMHRFAAYNAFVYGPPRSEVFGGAAASLCEAADAQLLSPNASVQKAAERVLVFLEGHRGDSSVIQPSPEVFQAVRTEHFREGGYYTLLLAGVQMPETGKIKPEVGDPILRQVLRNLGSTYTVADAIGKLWSLSHAQKAVLRPADYDMVPTRFVGLSLGHEVGSHWLERANGLRSGLQLLSSGLDRYEHGNEGRALIREQVMYPTFEAFAKTLRWQDILRRHLATSLAEGLAGQPMDFAEVYKRVNAVDMLYELAKKPEDVAAAQKQADHRTWQLLATSTHKGTDGHGSYRRYKVYLEGNKTWWDAAAGDPSIISAGDIGKYALHLRHIALLQANGVLPKVK